MKKLFFLLVAVLLGLVVWFIVDARLTKADRVVMNDLVGINKEVGSLIGDIEHVGSEYDNFISKSSSSDKSDKKSDVNDKKANDKVDDIKNQKVKINEFKERVLELRSKIYGLLSEYQFKRMSREAKDNVSKFGILAGNLKKEGTSLIDNSKQILEKFSDKK